MGKNERFTEIDLLRFIAAFTVMFFHYTIRGLADGDKLSPVKYPEFVDFSKYGYLGVDLFFLISGFVILMTALNRSAKGFFISRVVRLYPAYWVCCTLTFLTTYFLGTDVHKVSITRYVANMTMLHGFFPIGHVDGVYWTLFVEMKFYILVFLLVFLKQIRFIEYYLGLWLILSLVAVGIPSKILEYVLITKYSAYFISGAVFYLIWKQGISLYRIILLGGSYFLAIFHAIELMTTKINWYHIPYNIGVLFALITFFLFLFFLVALKKTAFIRSELFVFLGALTYPMYLLHSRIGFVLFNHGQSFPDRFVLLLLVMALIGILSWFVHKYVERRFSPVLKHWMEKCLGSN